MPWATGTANTGYSSGTPLPTVSGTVMAQYAFIRNFQAGALYDSGSNAADFTLMSSTGGTIGGQPSAIGSPTPANSSSPTEHNTTLYSTLADPSVASDVRPNRCISGDTWTISRTITNESTTTTYNDIEIQMSSLSQENGHPWRTGTTWTPGWYFTLVDPSGTSPCSGYSITCDPRTSRRRRPTPPVASARS